MNRIAAQQSGRHLTWRNALKQYKQAWADRDELKNRPWKRRKRQRKLEKNIDIDLTKLIKIIIVFNILFIFNKAVLEDRCHQVRAFRLVVLTLSWCILVGGRTPHFFLSLIHNFICLQVTAWPDVIWAIELRIFIFWNWLTVSWIDLCLFSSWFPVSVFQLHWRSFCVPVAS